MKKQKLFSRVMAFMVAFVFALAFLPMNANAATGYYVRYQGATKTVQTPLIEWGNNHTVEDYNEDTYGKKDYYTFEKWKSGSKTYAAGDTIESNPDVSSVTLVAQWAPTTYTIEYNLGGDGKLTIKGTSEDFEGDEAAACTLAGVKEVPEGKGAFKGWKIGNKEYAAGATYKFDPKGGIKVKAEAQYGGKVTLESAGLTDSPEEKDGALNANDEYTVANPFSEVGKVLMSVKVETAGGAELVNKNGSVTPLTDGQTFDKPEKEIIGKVLKNITETLKLVFKFRPEWVATFDGYGKGTNSRYVEEPATNNQVHVGGKPATVVPPDEHVFAGWKLVAGEVEGYTVGVEGKDVIPAFTTITLEDDSYFVINWVRSDEADETPVTDPTVEPATDPTVEPGKEDPANVDPAKNDAAKKAEEAKKAEAKKAEAKKAAAKSESPKTGDNNRIALLAGIMAVSAVGAFMLVSKKKKEADDK